VVLRLDHPAAIDRYGWFLASKETQSLSLRVLSIMANLSEEVYARSLIDAGCGMLAAVTSPMCH
jgi:hypothetical protein